MKTEEKKYVRQELGFVPPIRWDKKGERLVGTYCGSTMITPKSGDRAYRVHRVKWVEGDVRCEIDDRLITPETGQMVSLTGGYLDSSLAACPEGALIEIVFQGLGPVERGKNPAKMLKCYLLQTA